MKRPKLRSAAFAWLCASPLLAASPVIQAVNDAMDASVAATQAPGVVTLVANREGILHLGATGTADVERKLPMKEDTLFWIASMSKPIAGVAVMMMAEEGKLSLDDPLAKHLSEFARLRDASGSAVVITIRQCLTHCSGMTNLTPEEESSTRTLEEASKLAAAKPVKFPPGSKWEYCQSSINAAARVVEVVSGMSYPDFLEARIFAPLGMKDTSFYPDEARLARRAETYRKDENGKLVPVGIPLMGKFPPGSRNYYPKANAGLFSTAADYARFARMILRGGELDGRRYLKEESVGDMTHIQTGDLETGFTPGNGWGLGWCVVREPQGPSATLSPGSFGHGGAYGTQAWIDPVKDRIYLLFIQRSDLGNSDSSETRRAFQEAAQP